MEGKQHASAGHKLGQLIGDWYEEWFVLPLLKEAANKLNLYLDNRFVARAVRGAETSILWKDDDGNEVDYDFVMELGGKDTERGIPVAFFECFWRRGARHSKDKARDDSGKLLPMREVHPTARFLGILSGGDFTEPARTLVRSRSIDLFYVPKQKIVDAFRRVELTIDYPDKAAEATKAALLASLETEMPAKRRRVADALRASVGRTSLLSYVDRLRASLGAVPQEIRFFARRQSKPQIFDTIPNASRFLDNPVFDYTDPREGYVYEITYTDGTEFERSLDTIEAVKHLHKQIERLAQHMGSLRS